VLLHQGIDSAVFPRTRSIQADGEALEIFPSQLGEFASPSNLYRFPARTVKHISHSIKPERERSYKASADSSSVIDLRFVEQFFSIINVHARFSSSLEKTDRIIKH
jgi:hypothetical protein